MMVDVAQLVEPRIVIPVVVGSNPIIHPKAPDCDSGCRGFESHHSPQLLKLKAEHSTAW